MIQFVNPIWLAAAAAVVVPVILHMWNDRRGKVLRIGSVALLTGGAQRMAWRRRVSRWLLLLVRCLLLAAVACLLARPYFGLGTRAKGWVLTAFEGGRVADSLVKAGWERQIFPDTNNYWEGFRLADRMAPAGIPFFVLTPALARRFAGERPVTDREVGWDVVLPGDSVSRWIQKAWVMPGDSVRVLEGFSRATGSWYSAKTVAARDMSVTAWDGMVAPGGPVVVDTSVLRVAVVADEAYREDARYVKAALVALQKYTSRRMVVVDGMGAGGNWLFWLSDRPVVDQEKYVRVFEYAAWKKSKGNVNDLVWSSAFPVWLGQLLFDGKEMGEKDRRVLDPEQIVPLRGGASVGRSVTGSEESEVGGFEVTIWGIVIILFIVDRILSDGKKKA